MDLTSRGYGWEVHQGAGLGHLITHNGAGMTGNSILSDYLDHHLLIIVLGNRVTYRTLRTWISVVSGVSGIPIQNRTARRRNHGCPRRGDHHRRLQRHAHPDQEHLALARRGHRSRRRHRVGHPTPPTVQEQDDAHAVAGRGSLSNELEDPSTEGGDQRRMCRVTVGSVSELHVDDVLADFMRRDAAEGGIRLLGVDGRSSGKNRLAVRRCNDR